MSKIKLTDWFEIDEQEYLMYILRGYEITIHFDFHVEFGAWTLNSVYHREDGPAIIWEDGDKWWYLNGLRHREDGPAVIRANGSHEWWLNDELHREDGPAVIWEDGDKWWYRNGIECTEDEYE